MVLLILGVIFFILGSSLLKADAKFAAVGKPFKITGLVLILIGALSSSVRQVDAGYVGVKALFGKVQNETLSSGLNMINPLMSVTDIDIRTQNYTMSGVHDEGTKSGDDAIKVLTADGLEVTIDLSVLYRVNPVEAPKMIREIGINFEDKIVRPITRTRIRDNSVYYDAVALYSTKRDEFQSRIFKTIETDFKQRGLILENLLVRNITLPASV
ncbi:MAG: hypothetical protein RLZZ172_2475, partial [Bacteroidota bacterium]